MLEASILSISAYFLLVFDTVPTVWYFVIFEDYYCSKYHLFYNKNVDIKFSVHGALME